MAKRHSLVHGDAALVTYHGEAEGALLVRFEHQRRRIKLLRCKPGVALGDLLKTAETWLADQYSQWCSRDTQGSPPIGMRMPERERKQATRTVPDFGGGDLLPSRTGRAHSYSAPKSLLAPTSEDAPPPPPPPKEPASPPSRRTRSHDVTAQRQTRAATKAEHKNSKKPRITSTLRGGDDVKFKAAGMKHYRAGKVGWLLEDGTHKVKTIDGEEFYLPPSDLIKLTMPQLGPKRPPEFSSVKQYRAAGRAAVRMEYTPHGSSHPTTARWTAGTKCPRLWPKAATTPPLPHASRVDQRCGGDLLFFSLMLASGLLAVFPMGPNSKADMAGSRLPHITLKHHKKRDAGCEAHVSLVAQTSVNVLKISQEENANYLMRDAMVAATLDAHENWGDAAWVPVWQKKICSAELEEKDAVDVCFDETTMERIPAGRTVLFDGDESSPTYGLVLAFYHAGGEPALGHQLRTHFAVLAERPDKDFNAKRATGHLKETPQRMELVGFHNDGLNWSRRVRAEQRAVNGDHHGTIAPFADNLDAPHFWLFSQKEPLYEKLSLAIQSATPRLAAWKSAIGKLVDTDRRAVYDLGAYLDDARLLEFVGITSAYWSPAHEDLSDVGFTTIIAGKCGPRSEGCGCDPDGCAACFRGRDADADLARAAKKAMWHGACRGCR